LYFRIWTLQFSIKEAVFHAPVCLSSSLNFLPISLVSNNQYSLFWSLLASGRKEPRHADRLCAAASRASCQTPHKPLTSNCISSLSFVMRNLRCNLLLPTIPLCYPTIFFHQLASQCIGKIVLLPENHPASAVSAFDVFHIFSNLIRQISMLKSPICILSYLFAYCLFTIVYFASLSIFSCCYFQPYMSLICILSYVFGALFIYYCLFSDSLYFNHIYSSNFGNLFYY